MTPGETAAADLVFLDVSSSVISDHHAEVSAVCNTLRGSLVSSPARPDMSPITDWTRTKLLLFHFDLVLGAGPRPSPTRSLRRRRGIGASVVDLLLVPPRGDSLLWLDLLVTGVFAIGLDLLVTGGFATGLDFLVTGDSAIG